MPKVETEIISLISQIKTKEKGFNLLLKTYKVRLYWHIRRLVVQHEVAEDVLQNTFLKIYQNIEKFKHQSSLYTWIYRIATNEALQEIQKMKKNLSIDDEQMPDYLEGKVQNELKYTADEIQVFLEKAIQKLPEKQKLVFIMRYYDEMPYEKMSEILEMSVVTLKTNYHYAKNKVEQYILNNL